MTARFVLGGREGEPLERVGVVAGPDRNERPRRRWGRPDRDRLGTGQQEDRGDGQHAVRQLRERGTKAVDRAHLTSPRAWDDIVRPRSRR